MPAFENGEHERTEEESHLVSLRILGDGTQLIDRTTICEHMPMVSSCDLRANLKRLFDSFKFYPDRRNLHAKEGQNAPDAS